MRLEKKMCLFITYMFYSHFFYKIIKLQKKFKKQKTSFVKKTKNKMYFLSHIYKTTLTRDKKIYFIFDILIWLRIIKSKVLVITQCNNKYVIML